MSQEIYDNIPASSSRIPPFSNEKNEQHSSLSPVLSTHENLPPLNTSFKNRYSRRDELVSPYSINSISQGGVSNNNLNGTFSSFPADRIDLRQRVFGQSGVQLTVDDMLTTFQHQLTGRGSDRTLGGLAKQFRSDEKHRSNRSGGFVDRVHFKKVLYDYDIGKVLGEEVIILIVT